eukprot:9495214-Pyramimonas_sp.AAC.1
MGSQGNGTAGNAGGPRMIGGEGSDRVRERARFEPQRTWKASATLTRHLAKPAHLCPGTPTPPTQPIAASSIRCPRSGNTFQELRLAKSSWALWESCRLTQPCSHLISRSLN